MDTETVKAESIKDHRKLATAGFILSIISFVLVFLTYGWVLVLPGAACILGLVFSIIGIRSTRKGLSIAGLVISIISTLALIFFGIPWAGNNQSQGQNKNYQLPQTDKAIVYRGRIGENEPLFNVEVPAGWQVKETPEEKLKVIFSNQAGEATEKITLGGLQGNYGLGEFEQSDLTVNPNPDGIKNYKFIAKDKKIINGITMVRVDYSGTIQVNKSLGKDVWEVEDKDTQVAQYYFQKNSWFYTLSFSANLTEWQNAQPLFEKTINSFKFVE